MHLYETHYSVIYHFILIIKQNILTFKKCKTIIIQATEANGNI